jgi:hypothetical protein
VTDPKKTTNPTVEVKTVTVEEFMKLFGNSLNTEAMFKAAAERFLHYGNSYERIGVPTLEDHGYKAGDRVKYAPGDEPEDIPELIPGDVGTVVGTDGYGIAVRWDRIGRDVPIYNGELDELGILEQLADLASDKETFPMTKSVN